MPASEKEKYGVSSTQQQQKQQQRPQLNTEESDRSQIKKNNGDNNKLAFSIPNRDQMRTALFSLFGQGLKPLGSRAAIGASRGMIPIHR